MNYPLLPGRFSRGGICRGLLLFPAGGFLTGKYRSQQDANKSVRGEGASEYLDEKGERVLKALDAVANKYESQVATVALAWLLAQQNIVAPEANCHWGRGVESGVSYF